MSKEIWKDIKGYEGLYQISNFGRVRSFAKKRPKILKQHNVGVYKRVGLSKDKKRKHYLVHRLVAEAFIPNEQQYPQVNHIKPATMECCDNSVYNLEWCNQRQNTIHGYKYGNMSKTNKKRAEHCKKQFSQNIEQYDLENNFINSFYSIREASRKTNISVSHICRCCNGEISKAKNYIFKIASDNK